MGLLVCIADGMWPWWHGSLRTEIPDTETLGSSRLSITENTEDRYEMLLTLSVFLSACLSCHIEFLLLKIHLVPSLLLVVLIDSSQIHFTFKIHLKFTLK